MGYRASVNRLASPAASPALPALVAAAGDRAGLRFLEFFAAAIRNPHTRRAYARAVGDFLAWCERHGVPSLAAVQPLHVATWVEVQTRTHAAPTVKQRLAAVRHLFDWLVTGQVVPANPAASVRGPAYSVRVGKTPVLAPEEARTLLDSIDVTTPVGLRDRALIALMVYSFARVGAALGMRVEDAYVQNRRLWGGCTRRAASGTRCPATTISKSTCTPTSTAPASPPTRRGRCSAP